MCVSFTIYSCDVFLLLVRSVRMHVKLLKIKTETNIFPLNCEGGGGWNKEVKFFIWSMARVVLLILSSVVVMENSLLSKPISSLLLLTRIYEKKSNFTFKIVFFLIDAVGYVFYPHYMSPINPFNFKRINFSEVSIDLVLFFVFYFAHSKIKVADFIFFSQSYIRVLHFSVGCGVLCVHGFSPLFSSILLVSLQQNMELYICFFFFFLIIYNFLLLLCSRCTVHTPAILWNLKENRSPNEKFIPQQIKKKPNACKKQRKS